MLPNPTAYLYPGQGCKAITMFCVVVQLYLHNCHIFFIIYFFVVYHNWQEVICKNIARYSPFESIGNMCDYFTVLH